MNNKNVYKIKIVSPIIGLFFLVACASPAAETQITASSIPSITKSPPIITVTTTPSTTPTHTLTLTPIPSETPNPSPIPKNTETISEMLKTHIVFFLIVPEKGRTDACGDITLEPVISKRYRSGDNVEDVQIALNMLFNMGTKYYGSYYNALWDTELNINSYEYNAKKNGMIIDFGGFLPVMELSKCDKHGIREQNWKTFYYYGFKDKIFTYNGKFLIDQLSR